MYYFVLIVNCYYYYDYYYIYIYIYVHILNKTNILNKTYSMYINGKMNGDSDWIQYCWGLQNWICEPKIPQLN